MCVVAEGAIGGGGVEMLVSDDGGEGEDPAAEGFADDQDVGERRRNVSQANILPVRPRQVGISSRIKSAPCLSQAARTFFQ